METISRDLPSPAPFDSTIKILPIPGRTGYWADAFGRIYSSWKPRQRILCKAPITRRVTTLFTHHRTTYEIVSLRVGGKTRGEQVGRLVLKAFVGLPPRGYVCCHGTGGSLDNRLSNLRWGTVQENNVADRMRDGTYPVGQKTGVAKLKDADIPKILRLRGRFSTREVGERYGVCHSTIGRIWRGSGWKHAR